VTVLKNASSAAKPAIARIISSAPRRLSICNSGAQWPKPGVCLYLGGNTPGVRGQRPRAVALPGQGETAYPAAVSTIS
jgi:hypothetical protein